MGIPTSEVGYTSAMPRREDHEVHKDMWGHLEKKMIPKYFFNLSPSLKQNTLYINYSNHPLSVHLTGNTPSNCGNQDKTHHSHQSCDSLTTDCYSSHMCYDLSHSHTVPNGSYIPIDAIINRMFSFLTLFVSSNVLPVFSSCPYFMSLISL